MLNRVGYPVRRAKLRHYLMCRSELIKGGGNVKCCTQEIRPARNTRATSVVREEHQIKGAGASL
jgi:hypothetical protein